MVSPGGGTAQAPDGTRIAHAQDRSADRGFTKVFADAAAGRGVLVLLLLAAFAWGAVHALSPGHGKAMVAAYLVGTRGTPRHALALGGIVTLTHTIGVFALGGVTLALSAYVLPEDLYPWLNLVSGLLVVGIGARVLRSHLRRARRRVAHHHHHGHDRHGHLPARPGWRGVMAMGASAGLIPCPSALVVLLGAVSQGQVALGHAADRRLQRGPGDDAERPRAGGGAGGAAHHAGRDPAPAGDGAPGGLGRWRSSASAAS